MMTAEEYIRFLKNFAPNDEAMGAADLADHEQARNELIDFIQKNNLDCSHLRDYSRKGWEKQTDDWNAFIEKLLEITDKYGLWYDPDEDEEGEEQ